MEINDCIREISDCIEELDDYSRKARNAYMREWRKKHPGKQREYQQRFWEKKGKELYIAQKEAEALRKKDA